MDLEQKQQDDPLSVPVQGLSTVNETTPKILIILPFSGAQFTGGLAVVNEQITKELVQLGYPVKLLTYQLADEWMATAEGHGLNKGDLLVIEDEETLAFATPGNGAGGSDRDKLYEKINSEEVILGKQVADLLDNWTPNIIIGHSRFSGKAAVLLRDSKYTDAKVGYFLHSYPLVEGKLLTGYEAFQENKSIEDAQVKLQNEKEWIGQADVVLTMGPLLRLAALSMLEEGCRARVHEVISGISKETREYPELDKEGPVTLLLCGRASAPVKGYQDIVLAALKLRNMHRDDDTVLTRKVLINVRGMGEQTYAAHSSQGPFEMVGQDLQASQEYEDIAVDANSVQEWTEGVFGVFEEQQAQAVRIRVLGTVSKDIIMEEYKKSHGVLTAAYFEHFGLVPFEALSMGRPVLISELSGSGQFLSDGRCEAIGKECVVMDLGQHVEQPLNKTILEEIPDAALEERADVWCDAIQKLVNNIDERIESAGRLFSLLEENYTSEHFAQSIVEAFNPNWGEKTTKQIEKGGVKEVPK
jgi:glycosyltransferase involved in cell wall biosynthesis